MPWSARRNKPVNMGAGGGGAVVSVVVESVVVESLVVSLVGSVVPEPGPGPGGPSPVVSSSLVLDAAE